MDGIDVANKVRGKRCEKRMSQKAMAKELNITEKTYSFKESNRTSFTVDDLIRIAKILDCNLSDFFYNGR